MPFLADRTKESTTSTGTGAITTSGVAATGGYQTFATATQSQARVVGYAIVDAANNAFEVGKGTFNGTTGLTRDLVRSSSNGGNLVSFAAGTKDVFITPSSELVDNANTGMQYAAARGYLWP